jgi:hypothetical protein
MIKEALYLYHIYLDRVLYLAGSTALSAKQGLNVLSSLSDDQLEKEVLLWFSTIAAGLQDRFAQIALGRPVENTITYPSSFERYYFL